MLRILRNRHLLIEIRAISGNGLEEISGKLDSIPEGSVTNGLCQRPEPALFSAPLIVIKIASHFPKRDGPTWMQTQRHTSSLCHARRLRKFFTSLIKSMQQEHRKAVKSFFLRNWRSGSFKARMQCPGQKETGWDAS